ARRSSSGFRLADLHPRLRSEAQLAAGDDALAGLEALRDDGALTVAPRDADLAHVRQRVFADDVHVLPFGAVLQRARRNDDRIGLLIEPQAHVDELPGP